MVWTPALALGRRGHGPEDEYAAPASERGDIPVPQHGHRRDVGYSLALLARLNHVPDEFPLQFENFSETPVKGGNKNPFLLGVDGFRRRGRADPDFPDEMAQGIQNLDPVVVPRSEEHTSE